jgi:2,5-diketo-D-gluconate reductase A
MAALLPSLLPLLLLAKSTISAAVAPTVPIAPGLHMPLINDGVSDRSIWIGAGGRGLDTALSYGDSDQEDVLKSIKASGLPRSAFFVTTKVPCCPARAFPFPYAERCAGPRNATADAEHNAKLLGSVPDLVLMHWPCDDFEGTLATWREMETLVERGLARSIGVSNFNSSLLAALLAEAKVKPAVNQCGFSIAGHNESRWGRDDATLHASHAAGVAYSAYSPLGGWTRTDVLHHPTVVKVALAHKKTTAQVALRWVVQQQVVAVTSAKNAEYAKEDLNIFDFVLTASEMAELSAI